MSFQINWDLLADGVEANKLKEFINERFQTEERPLFLGEIQVTELDFGDIPPEIAVENITDPLEEFYYEEDEEYNRYTNMDMQHSFTASVEGSLSDFGYQPAYSERPRDANHVQIEVSVKYKGNLRMSIITALIINQPTPAFMTLPVSLTVSGCSFEATAVIAYLGDVINFCLKSPSNEG